MQPADQALSRLRAHGVILHNTDTVPGLACLATSTEAVARIRTIKHRLEDKAFILLCSGTKMLHHYAEVPAVAESLLTLSWDVPITIVYTRLRQPLPSAADGSVAIRIPASQRLRAFVDLVGVPLLSTSANLSGEAAPRFMTEVTPVIRQAVDFIWDDDADSAHRGQASSLLRLAGGRWNVLRRGSGIDRIESLIGRG